MRVFEQDAIRAALGPADALGAAERALFALGNGQARLPDPVALHLPEVEGEVHVKGAHLEGSPIFAFKVATGFYRNPERGLPTGSGLFLVFDARTGAPLGLLRDDGWLTELRTGAMGALAARMLTGDRPLTVAIIGTGQQARFQIRALAHVRDVAELRAWSPDPASTRDYLDDVEEWGDLKGLRDAGLAVAASAEEAVRGADLVMTVTPAREPIVRDAWVGPGATVVAVGSDGPGKCELEPALVAGADKVVVDRLEQSVRLGELQRPVAEGLMEPGDVWAELGDIHVGRRPGRESPAERIVCDLTGVGAQDAAIAEVAWRMLTGAPR